VLNLSNIKSAFYTPAVLEHLLSVTAAVVSRYSMLLVTIVNTQMMPSEEFGLFVILLLIANLITAFVSCGGDMWLNRFSRPRHLAKNHAPIVARLYLKISIALAGVVVLTALYLGFFNSAAFNHAGRGIAWCLAWAAMTGIIETILAVLRTTHVIQRFFIIRDFFMPIALIASIVFFKVNTVEKFFMIAFTIGAITLGLLSKLVFSRKHHYFPHTRWHGQLFQKVIIGHTIALILNNLLARLANGQDALLLARTESMVLVGQYRFVTHFAYAFNMIQHYVFLAFPWQLRKANANSTYFKETQGIKLRQLLLIISAFPALVLLIFIAKPLLTILGPEFPLMALPLSFCLIIRFSELLWGPQHEILISNKKVFWDTLANVITILIGGCVFFTSLHYWENGIASGLFSLGFSSIAGQLTRHFILKKYDLLNKTDNFRLNPWYPTLAVFASMIYLFITME